MARVTPVWQVTIILVSSTSRISRKRSMDMMMEGTVGMAAPQAPVPPPRGMTGVLVSLHSFRMAETSS